MHPRNINLAVNFVVYFASKLRYIGLDRPLVLHTFAYKVRESYISYRLARLVLPFPENIICLAGEAVWLYSCKSCTAGLAAAVSWIFLHGAVVCYTVFSQVMLTSVGLVDPEKTGADVLSLTLFSRWKLK